MWVPQSRPLGSRLAGACLQGRSQEAQVCKPKGQCLHTNTKSVRKISHSNIIISGQIYDPNFRSQELSRHQQLGSKKICLPLLEIHTGGRILIAEINLKGIRPIKMH